MKYGPLDRDLYVPLYHQLKEILLNEIRTGKLKPDDRLPAEDQVAASYGVSVITVRRTLSDLAAAGYLRRERGRGTFVSRPAVALGPRELTSFTGEMIRRDLSSSSIVLEQGVLPADAALAEELRIAESDPVFRLRRLRLADGEPMGLQTAHIPAALTPGLENRDLTGSLYAVLEKDFGLVPAHAREIHSATLITGSDAAALRLPEGSLGLAARRWTYLAGGRPFEFVTSVMRGDRYEIVLDLAAKRPVR
jgi:GntR family transcriptional regulator